jgi:hypothetical protein
VKYPTVAGVLTEPLLRDAKVDVSIKPSMVDDKIKFHVDTASAKLILPNVTLEEMEQLPHDFEMIVKHHYESPQAISSDFFFTFAVNIHGAEQQPNGEEKLKYDATFKNYRHEE